MTSLRQRGLQNLNKWFNNGDVGFERQIRYYLSQLPFTSDLVRLYEADLKRSDYMSNRGINWNDVRYTTDLPSGGLSGSANLGKALVERNMDAISKLYDIDQPKKFWIPADEWNEYDRSKFKRW